MPSPPFWQIDSNGPDALPVRLSGDWLVRADEERSGRTTTHTASYRAMGHCTRLRFDATSVAHWDSSLLAFIWLLAVLRSIEANATQFEMDPSGLPEPLRAHARPRIERSPGKPRRPLQTGQQRDNGASLFGMVASACRLGRTDRSVCAKHSPRVARTDRRAAPPTSSL